MTPSGTGGGPLSSMAVPLTMTGGVAVSPTAARATATSARAALARPRRAGVMGGSAGEPAADTGGAIAEVGEPGPAPS